MTIQCVSSLVIFGGTGDLSRRKLIPAVCRLAACNALPSDLHLILTGRKPTTREALFHTLEDGHPEFRAQGSLSKNGLERLRERIHFIPFDPSSPEDPPHFQKRLEDLESRGAAPARLFYLAVPPAQVPAFLFALPSFFDPGSTPRCPSRLLLEKPFGTSLITSRELNSLVTKVAGEDRVLRIDHYLGKEAVQNILVFRFANTFFEPVWNRQFIDHVQISFAERIGIGTRGPFFDATGIMRDVVQNHLLQVLCLTAMEPPLSHRLESIRMEKRKVLAALHPIKPAETPANTVRAQYFSGSDASGPLRAYTDEQGVAPDSQTETYTALRVFVDSWRWAGVPFYLRAGKRLSSAATEIAVFFKKTPINLFPPQAGEVKPNHLVIRVQPNDGIHLSMNSKEPGMTLKLSETAMDFSYQTSFGSFRPDAYERLLLDALNGNPSLFLSSEEIESAWGFVDPILEGWHQPGLNKLHEYPANSKGPEAADQLIQADGRKWRPLGSAER